MRHIIVLAGGLSKLALVAYQSARLPSAIAQCAPGRQSGLGGEGGRPSSDHESRGVHASRAEALGIPEGLVRYSVGIEDVEDLMTDLQQALK